MSINLSNIYSSHKVLYTSSEENFKSFNVLSCFIKVCEELYIEVIVIVQN